MVYTPTKSAILDDFIKDDFAETCTPFSTEALNSKVWVSLSDYHRFDNHPYDTSLVKVHGIENMAIEVYFAELDYAETLKNTRRKNPPEVMTFRELLTYARNQIYGINFGYTHYNRARNGEFAAIAYMDIERYYDFMVSGAKYFKDPADYLRANKRYRENLSNVELRTGFKSIPVLERYRAKNIRELRKQKISEKPLAKTIVQREPDKSIVRAIQNKISCLDLGLTAEVMIKKNGDPEVNKNIVAVEILMAQELTITQAAMLHEAIAQFESQLEAQVIVDTYVQTLPTTKELHEIRDLILGFGFDLRAEVYFGKSKGPIENSVSIVLDVEYTRLLSRAEEDLLDQFHWALSDQFGIRVGVIRSGYKELIAAKELEFDVAIANGSTPEGGAIGL